MKLSALFGLAVACGAVDSENSMFERWAQHALDASDINMNATLYNFPDDLTTDRDGGKILFDDFSLYNFPGDLSTPSSARLESTEWVMHLPQGDFWTGAHHNGTDIAWFTLPDQNITDKLNVFTFGADTDRTLHVLDPEAFVTFWFGLILGLYREAPVWIVGKPRLSSLSFSANLKLGKQLQCTCISPPDVSSNETDLLFQRLTETQKSEEPITARRLLQGLPPISVACKQTGNMHSDKIDSVLATFEHELSARTPPFAEGALNSMGSVVA